VVARQAAACDPEADCDPPAAGSPSGGGATEAHRRADGPGL